MSFNLSKGWRSIASTLKCVSCAITKLMSVPLLVLLVMLASAGIGHSDDNAIPKKGGGWYKVGASYEVNGRRYVPAEAPDYRTQGIASWYGRDFHGRRTANGELYDMNALTAAHKTLPMPSYVRVTNLANNRTLLLRVNDRGPFVDGRIIDLSRAAARLLGFEHQGHAQVEVTYAGLAPIDGDDTQERSFLTSQSWHGAPEQYAASPALVPVSAHTPPLDAVVTGSLSPLSKAPATPKLSSKPSKAAQVKPIQNADEEDERPPSRSNGRSTISVRTSGQPDDDDSHNDWRCAAFKSCNN